MLYVGRLCICTFMFIVLISCCALARRDMIARGVPLRDFIFLEEIEILGVLTLAPFNTCEIDGLLWAFFPFEIHFGIEINHSYNNQNNL